MQKIRVSAVSYLNTIPFLFGIKHSGLLSEEDFIISLDYPVICAQKMLNHQADISLIPVAAIPMVKNARIISNYCIGATSEVKSVLLLSDVPLNEINKIYLDYQSKTSVNLVRILASKLWEINPEWLSAESGFENHIGGTTAGVIIGDRSFDYRNKFEYSYDLAGEWIKLTGKPFVFACWLASDKVDQVFADQFNQALKFGVENIDTAVSTYSIGRNISQNEASSYLKDNISYILDQEKIEGMKLFLESIK